MVLSGGEITMFKIISSARHENLKNRRKNILKNSEEHVRYR